MNEISQVLEMLHGRLVTDKETGLTEKIIKTTKNSLLITQTQTNEHGINCDQWFTDKQFIKQFDIE